MSARQFYLRSYPVPDGMAAHAATVEQDGWDGLLLTDSQNLSMDVFASLGIAAAAVPGSDVDVEGFDSRITWLPIPGESRVPVDVFGSGPRVLGVGATSGDRVTATVAAEPEVAHRTACRQPTTTCE